MIFTINKLIEFEYYNDFFQDKVQNLKFKYIKTIKNISCFDHLMIFTINKLIKFEYNDENFQD